jgi:hypothetical protein
MAYITAHPQAAMQEPPSITLNAAIPPKQTYPDALILVLTV